MQTHTELRNLLKDVYKRKWFSQPVSDILSFILSLVLAGMEMKRLKKMRA